jgi:hypothetical protein
VKPSLKPEASIQATRREQGTCHPSRDESGPPMSQILEVGMAVAAADMPAV